MGGRSWRTSCLHPSLPPTWNPAAALDHVVTLGVEAQHQERQKQKLRAW